MTSAGPIVHVLLSGRLCTGKTTLALSMHARYGFTVVSARAVLRELAPVELNSRRELQTYGEKLEAESGGSWLADALARMLATGQPELVVDSARSLAQLRHAREALGAGVVHVHLTAGDDELARRFRLRQDEDIREAPSLDVAMQSFVERTVDELKDHADYVIDTMDREPEDLATTIYTFARQLRGTSP